MSALPDFERILTGRWEVEVCETEDCYAAFTIHRITPIPSIYHPEAFGPELS